MATVLSQTIVSNVAQVTLLLLQLCKHPMLCVRTGQNLTHTVSDGQASESLDGPNRLMVDFKYVCFLLL